MMTGDDLESRGRSKNSHRLENYSSSSSYARTETYWTSWLIPVFVIANIAVFVVLMYVNNCPKHNRYRIDGKCVARFLGRFSFQRLRENPLIGASSNTLEKLGALQWWKIVHGHQGWRLVTANWLHAGVIHLVTNMLSLVLIGIRLEQQFGFLCVGMIYLLSGFGGSILSSLFLRNNISVGASGALFGLLGTMLSELITNWSIYTNKGAALTTLIVIIVVNLAVGILPFVDNFAHIGGFLTGFLLGFVLLPRPQFGWLERHTLPADVRVRSKYKGYQYVLGLLALVLLVAGYVNILYINITSVVGVICVSLYKSDNRPSITSDHSFIWKLFCLGAFLISIRWWAINNLGKLHQLLLDYCLTFIFAT